MHFKYPAPLHPPKGKWGMGKREKGDIRHHPIPPLGDARGL